MANIFSQPIIEDVLLLALESFALLAKANATEISQFELQLLNDEAVVLNTLFEALIIRLDAGY